MPDHLSWKLKYNSEFGEWSFLYFSFTKYEDGSNDSNILKNYSSSTINDELISAFRMMLEFPAAVQSGNVDNFPEISVLVPVGQLGGGCASGTDRCGFYVLVPTGKKELHVQSETGPNGVKKGSGCLPSRPIGMVLVF
jgi:hypothetical protein